MKVAEIKLKWFTDCVNELVDKGLTKKEISSRLGMMPQSLNNILNGSRGMSDEFMERSVKPTNL